MTKFFRWGFLGTGNIARQFGAGVRACERGRIVAVGSRTEERARTFAREYGVERSYASYEALLADREIDGVYVSLPNAMHREWTIKALEAGKHVLCEKPIAVNRAQAEEMYDVAGRKGLVLVEAFMYRAHPLTRAVRDTAKGGAIGDVRLIRTSFCYRTTRIADNIRFDPDLAGGALMDIGCYCINFSRLFAGAEPTVIHAAGKLHASGVDELVVGQMQFPDGVLASFTCGMGVQADNTAYVCGNEGYVETPVPWKPPAKGATYTLARSTPPRQDQQDAKAPPTPPRETRTVDAGKELYAIEADDFAATVLDGKPPMLTGQDTIGNMRVLDEMRRQVGVRVSS
jgi:D-xylose 1-dehydrogenase (NADP+, D-xylono-1,5-lactone-forming)